MKEEKKQDQTATVEDPAAKATTQDTAAETPKNNTGATQECSDKKAEASKKSETTEKAAAEDPLAAAQAKAKEFQDLYLRKAADFENYRKRMVREKQEAIEYANTQLLTDLLPILDNFDRAVAVKVEQTPESIKAFTDGIVMIKGLLEGMLARDYGLSAYNSKGEVFDPSIHEAVARAPSKEVTVQTVGEEISKGYKLKDRVLRHAKVLVLMPETEAETQQDKAEKAN